MSELNLRDLRREYAHAGLDESDLAVSPFDQFRIWFDAINRPETLDANAMVLATVGADGCPQQRTVLLKSFDQHGFVFFTNYQSRKGRAIEVNANVSLIFSWHVLERQVIIEGTAQKVPPNVSEEYFASRPLGSQIAAAISEQSQPEAGRAALETRFQSLERSLEGDNPKRPEHWGGYCVVPERFEFWQGRTNRLHDRLIYSRTDSGWQVSRLQP